MSPSAGTGHVALRDFTTDRRVLTLSAMAVVVGAMGAVVAKALFWLIAVFTNISYYGKLSSAESSPGGNKMGLWAVLVPIAGGLLIGLMARFGSEKIRGHGIPEALEAILIGESKMQPKVALLKPLTSAISIGTGGPFGSEGPIIMTAGACGSLFAQFFRLSAPERKILLVAGAAAGMSATFGAPVAAALIAVELLLFEWKPRSFIPVAVASGVAAALRPVLIQGGALFPMSFARQDGLGYVAVALLVGLVAGLASCVLTLMVYRFEDLFARLPFHWMWWPAAGGLIIGIGGIIEPRALGVGFSNIADMLQGRLLPAAVLSLLVVKAVIWSSALGSGTSGGVLAPLLMMGAAIGSLESRLIPGNSAALWVLVSMAAVMGGSMRAPLTAVLFALELTRQVDAALLLLVGCSASYAVTVLLMPRSILTEKIARRGHHLTAEYGIDPLELVPASRVMSADVERLPASMPVKDAVERMTGHRDDPKMRPHNSYPVVDGQEAVVGVVTRGDALHWAVGDDVHAQVADVMSAPPVVGYPEEPLAHLADRMAREAIGSLPIVERGTGRLMGIISRRDLLKARSRHLENEQRRERVFRGLSRISG